MGLQSLSGSAMRPRTPTQSGYSTTSTGSFITALNITGTGRLVLLASKVSSGSTGYYLKVTIDGIEVQVGTTIVAGTTTLSYHSPIDTSVSTTPRNYDLNFKKSLKIELKAGESTFGCSVYWMYELE